MLRIRERGGHHDFPSKICCRTIPKNFVGETCVSEKFWYRKILWMRRGGREFHDFMLEIFCLTVPKIFVEEPFCVAENFRYRKTSRRRERRASRLSIENLLSHNTEKFRRGNLCVRKVLVSQIFMDEKGRKGVSRFSDGNFLSHRAEKFRRGTLLCCKKFLISKNDKEKREMGGEHHNFP